MKTKVITEINVEMHKILVDLAWIQYVLLEAFKLDIITWLCVSTELNFSKELVKFYRMKTYIQKNETMLGLDSTQRNYASTRQCPKKLCY